MKVKLSLLVFFLSSVYCRFIAQKTRLQLFSSSFACWQTVPFYLFFWQWIRCGKHNYSAHDSTSGFNVILSDDICIKQTCVTGNATLSNPEPSKRIIQVVWRKIVRVVRTGWCFIQTDDQAVRTGWCFYRTDDKAVRTGWCFRQTDEQAVRTGWCFYRTDDRSRSNGCKFSWTADKRLVNRKPFENGKPLMYIFPWKTTFY